MKVASIILNYNDSKTTKNLVDKIKEYKNIDKIIIVDNNSTDNSYEELQKCKNNKVDVIKNENNEGYASGNNFGAFYAIEKYDVDYIMIANPDIFFEDNIIPNMLSELNKNENFAVATVKMNGTKNYWNIPNYWECIQSMFLLISKYKMNLKKEEKKENIREVEVVSGSFFIIKSKIFKEINGFDNKTFLYCEENILGKKLKDKGYKTIVLERYGYEHFHSVTVKKIYTSKMKPFKIYIDSLKIYMENYLKIGKIQKVIFNIFYSFAFIERKLYDIVYKFICKVNAKKQ